MRFRFLASNDMSGVLGPSKMMSSASIEQIIRSVTLDRNSDVPLYYQIGAYIETYILTGDLPDGSRLPSVRNLAHFLGVAPITVVEAYRYLQERGLIRAVAKSGFFVAITLPTDEAGVDAGRVEALIDEALEAAESIGMNRLAFLRLVSKRLKARASRQRVIAVVGPRDAALAERVNVVRDSLADLPVDVIGLALEDLESEAAGGAPARLSQVDCFLVPVGETQRAWAALGKHAVRSISWTRSLRGDVRDFIARQPEFTCFGVIVTSPYLGRTLSMLRRLHPLRVPPLLASIDDTEGVRRAIDEADVLLVGSLAKQGISRYGPVSKPMVELVYIPDDRTLRKLREWLEG